MKTVLSIGGIVAVVGVLGAAWVTWGSVVIEPGEEAIVLRLGRYDRTLRAGPHLYLPILETLERERVTNRRLEFGYMTRPEDSSSVESAETDAPALTYEPDLAERRMLTGDANIVDVEFVLEYDIVDLKSFRLSVENATGIIQDVARAEVREVIGQHSIDEVLRAARPSIEAKAADQIRSVMEAYKFGINVVSLKLQDVSPPEPVRDAFRDVASAQQDRDRVRLAAEGYRDEVVPRARGEARRLEAEAEAYRGSKVLAAEGESARFEALLTEYRKAPEVTRSRLYLETLEDLLPRMEKIIMKDGASERVLPYLPLSRPRQP